jgi:hypothetical protein
MPDISPVYRPRKPQDSQYYRCVDPLTCPKCSGAMKVISVIEDQEVIKKILKHLGLWQVKPRTTPAWDALVHRNPPVLNMLCQVFP